MPLMPSSTVAIRNLHKQMIVWVFALGFVLLSLSVVSAAESSMPWQCTSYTYTQATQEECLQIYSGEQGQKIADLERQLKRQEVQITELRNLISRQAQQQVQVRNVPAYPQAYNFAGPPPFAFGPQPFLRGGQFGYGSLLGFGLGLLPSVAIVID